eukprot:6196162-Pleurochrysis_carterae.AAC.5
MTIPDIAALSTSRLKLVGVVGGVFSQSQSEAAGRCNKLLWTSYQVFRMREKDAEIFIHRSDNCYCAQFSFLHTDT